MNYCPLPSQAFLASIVEYNPETGLFQWKTRAPDSFIGSEFRNTTKVAANWNSRWAGKLAFRKSSTTGYWLGAINGHSFAAHRLAWKLVTGRDPNVEIDHINGDRSDNRWSNLREVSRKVNRQNAQRNKNNTSGVPGVCWHKASKMWQAKIGHNYEKIHLGFFKDIQEAAKVRAAAEKEFKFHPTHGRDPVFPT
jgi:hypothetical protein